MRYGGGIFNDCKRDSIAARSRLKRLISEAKTLVSRWFSEVNHAVLAVGYGHDPKSGQGLSGLGSLGVYSAPRPEVLVDPQLLGPLDKLFSSFFIEISSS